MRSRMFAKAGSPVLDAGLSRDPAASPEHAHLWAAAIRVTLRLSRVVKLYGVLLPRGGTKEQVRDDPAAASAISVAWAVLPALLRPLGNGPEGGSERFS